MKNVLSVEQMKLSDKIECDRIGEINLINIVGKTIAENFDFKGNVLFVCGKGNNGADGVSCSNYLKTIGINSDILLLYKENRDTVEELIKLSNNVYYYNDEFDFSNYDIIFDCIYGVGFNGELDDYISKVIDKINKSDKYIISIDINSGLNADNGITKKGVKSNLTMSVGQYKLGHFLNDAKDYICNHINLDVGINPIEKPRYLIEESDLIPYIENRKNNSNKYNYGVTCIVGGCTNYSGAIKLASLANSSCKSGIGICKICIPSNIIEYVAPYVLESTIFPLKTLNNQYVFEEEQVKIMLNHVNTVVIGMGISKTDETIKLVKYLIENFNGVLIIDADGLNCLGEIGNDILNQSKAKIIITPHLMEFSRVSGLSISEINNNPVKIVEEFSKKYNVITLLKGPTTIISDGFDTYLSNVGCPGMATAGSGDVLSGILSSICVAHDNLLKRVCLGVYINGKAGELAEKKFGITSMTAGDTVSQIPYVLKEMENKKYPN